MGVFRKYENTCQRLKLGGSLGYADMLCTSIALSPKTDALPRRTKANRQSNKT